MDKIDFKSENFRIQLAELCLTNHGLAIQTAVKILAGVLFLYKPKMGVSSDLIFTELVAKIKRDMEYLEKSVNRTYN